jgi:hypothetical protein
VWDIGERVYAGVPELDAEDASLMLERRRLQAAGIARQKSPWTPVGTAGEPAVVEGRGGNGGSIRRHSRASTRIPADGWRS